AELHQPALHVRTRAGEIVPLAERAVVVRRGVMLALTEVVRLAVLPARVASFNGFGGLPEERAGLRPCDPVPCAFGIRRCCAACSRDIIAIIACPEPDVLDVDEVRDEHVLRVACDRREVTLHAVERFLRGGITSGTPCNAFRRNGRPVIVTVARIVEMAGMVL